ncbi:MAG: NADH-quinone oxidoreductase subunit C [Thermoanaerobaculia bacterium]
MAEETEKVEKAEKPAAAAAPEKPAARTVDEILADPAISAAMADVRSAIIDAREFAGEMILTVESSRIRQVCETLAREGFNYLVNLCGVDYSTYPGHTGARFAVVYHLYSFAKNVRIELKAFVPDGGSIPSVVAVWKTANWHERETYDMYGIEFEGHPNLERILTWDGFNGHPLRKDFPLRGIDTGARIYPEVFPEGGGPMKGSTGKAPDDVNLWGGDWKLFGRGPVIAPDTDSSHALPAAADDGNGSKPSGE